MFTYIKDYYNRGLYTVDNLKTFLQAGMITQEEYDSLVNESTPDN